MWRGSLLGCCSGCDSDAWGSCLLGYFVPCVAFGCALHYLQNSSEARTCILIKFCRCRQNMKRALNLSAWTQAVVFLVLFLVGRWLYVWSYAAVNASCPRPPPPQGRHDYHVAACLEHECLGFDILVKDATPLPGSFDNSDSAFEGHHNEHHHHNSTSGTRYVIFPWYMYLLSVATVTTMQLCLPSDDAVVHSVLSLWLANAECHQALAALGATSCVMVVLAIIGVVYAARRRTQIRQKFGITGSRLGDFCTWYW